jgi:hypothetical protein
MTEKEIIEMYEEMLKEWNGNLPNPEHEPIQFAYYVKLHKYYKQKESQ